MGKSIIDLIKSKVNSSMRVFEWGSGNSTMFWSQYVKEVVSIENNFEWYFKMKGKIASNVKLQYAELVYGGEYCKKIFKKVIDSILFLLMEETELTVQSTQFKDLKKME